MNILAKEVSAVQSGARLVLPSFTVVFVMRTALQDTICSWMARVTSNVLLDTLTMALTASDALVDSTLMGRSCAIRVVIKGTREWQAHAGKIALTDIRIWGSLASQTILNLTLKAAAATVLSSAANGRA